MSAVRAGVGGVLPVLFAFTVGAVSAEVPAEPVTSALVRAIESYERALDTPSRDLRLAEFRRSQRLFAGVVAGGVANAELYTNLGNAALQAEDLGAAVLAYRRALMLDADHPRALQNLAHVRSLLPAWVPRPQPAGVLDSFFFWHRTVPRASRILFSALSFTLVSLMITASIRFELAAFRNAAILPALSCIVLAVSVWLDPAAGARGEAVVTAPEAVARAADSALAPSAFADPLPAGVELRIVERRPPWLRVRLANGRDAWLRESSVRELAGGSEVRSGDVH